MRGQRRRVLAICVALFGPAALSACATGSPDVTAAATDGEFMAWFSRLGDEIAADPNYHRMPIDTPAQEDEFGSKLHQAFRGEITRAEFAQWANATYPGHAYEVEFFTRRLPG